jgi:cysteine synthase
LIARAKELSQAPNTFWTDQFSNIDNRNAYHAMAREIIGVLGKKIVTIIVDSGLKYLNGDLYKEMPQRQ